MAYDRRNLLRLAAASGAALAAVPVLGAPRARGSRASTETAPEGTAALAAFTAAFGGAFDRERRLTFLADDALVIAHDVPMVLDRTGYADHLAFHSNQWDLLEWALIEPLAVAHGGTVIISSYFNERGKPKSSGFRLRSGFATATCCMFGGQWRAIGLHSSALRGQILDASPS